MSGPEQTGKEERVTGQMIKMENILQNGKFKPDHIVVILNVNILYKPFERRRDFQTKNMSSKLHAVHKRCFNDKDTV